LYGGESEVSDYTCYRTSEPIEINGDLTKPVWANAPRSRRFVDVVTGRPALLDSRAAALWDDDYLYVAFWNEEPLIEAAFTERDSLIYYENDIEVFIDGGDCYYEFELNARNTIYEVFFIWQDAYERGGRFEVPEFDLHSGRAISFGGNFDRIGQHMWWGAHPRGTRWGFPDWDMPGLKTAVQLDGTLNDNSDVDRGWTAELACPWAGMTWLADGRTLPPSEGDAWRLQFARYEKLNLGGNDVHVGWAWDRIGSMDNHAPQCFTRLHFTSDQPPLD
jgi:hypothetical protein